MNARCFMLGTWIALGLAGVWFAFHQHRRLTDLRAEHQRLVARTGDASEHVSSAAAAEVESATDSNPRPSASASSELLQLRSQVSQLTVRRRELAAVRGENERLQAQLKDKAAKAPGGPALPPGYLRKSQAQWVGLNTPENTLQCFLWALQNRDLTNLLQVLSPASGQEVMREIGASPEDFFKQASAMPGVRLLNPHQLPDGTVEGQLEIIPGMEPRPIHFILIDGQWRMEMH